MLWLRLKTALLLGAVAASGPQAIAQDAGQKLAERPWTVVSVRSLEPVSGHLPTLTFDSKGRLSGSGGCNRLTGDYRHDSSAGNAFSIGGIASTRMLCAGSVMRYEQALLATLKTVDALSFREDGRLMLLHRGVPLIVLK
jgi:heat shock protein HslJ